MTPRQEQLVIMANELDEEDLFHLVRLLIRLWYLRSKR